MRKDVLSFSPLKILVLRFSSIGDIVLTTPVLRGLREQLGAEIHYATKPQYVPLLEANPHLSGIHLLHDSLIKLARQLRKERFDYVIDLHHNLRTYLLKCMLGVRSYSYYKMNIEKWMYVRFRWPRLRTQHVVDRYWKAASSLGVEPDEEGLEYHIPQAESSGFDLLPTSFSTGYVAFAVGGKWSTKKLPLQQLITLCDKINYPVVLLGGEEDAPIGRAVENFFENKSDTVKTSKSLRALAKHTTIYNSCGRFTLHQSAAVIRDAVYVFSHDTGMMHIAAAFRKEIFSIWGSTVPEFGMYPYKTRFTVLERRGLSCRPCSKIGYRSCPRDHFRCMKEIPTEFFLPLRKNVP